MHGTHPGPNQRTIVPDTGMAVKAFFPREEKIFLGNVIPLDVESGFC